MKSLPIILEKGTNANFIQVSFHVTLGSGAPLGLVERSPVVCNYSMCIYICVFDLIVYIFIESCPINMFQSTFYPKLGITSDIYIYILMNMSLFCWFFAYDNVLLLIMKSISLLGGPQGTPFRHPIPNICGLPGTIVARTGL